MAASGERRRQHATPGPPNTGPGLPNTTPGLPNKFFIADLATAITRAENFLVQEVPPALAHYELQRPVHPHSSTRAPLYMPLARRWQMADLSDQVKPLLEGESGDCDALVFRVHPGDEAALRAQAGRDASLRSRARDRQLWMLVLQENRHRLLALDEGIDEQLDEAEERVYIDFLRECELTTYSQRPGVYLSGAEGFHYEAPNGRHYEAFLRVGNMLNSIEAVEAICFWLAPRLASADLVLLDSPSILALGLRARDYVGTLSDARPFEVETLRDYGELEVTLAPRIEAHQPDARDGTGRVVLLLSMVSSGALITRLTDICETHGFDVESVPVFASPDIAGIDPLCRVGGISRPQPEIKVGEQVKCPLCQQGSSAAKILPDTYTLDVAVHAQRVEISQRDATAGEALLKRYRGSDFVRLHRSEQPGGRHHAIYVDGGQLLNSPNFRGLPAWMWLG